MPRSLPKIDGRPDSINRSNASSCPTDDHQFVAFGVGDPPAVLRLVKEPATGCDGRGEARLHEVRGHSELEVVNAIALPAILTALRLNQIGSPSMDMLKGEQIAAANLTDWRKLAQGLHARYVVDDFGTGARFVAAVGEAGDALGHHPSVSIGNGYVDLKLISDDAIYRDGEGTEHVVEWVTQQDVDLARRITEIAADHKVDADPASVSVIELGLDTAHSATIAPMWAALLTGSAEAQGHGSPSDEIRDATGRVPNLWFGDADEHETPRQRFHIEVYVAPEVAAQRITAALAAGGTVVDDSNAPSLTVIADQDGNKGIVCVDVSAAKKD